MRERIRSKTLMLLAVMLTAMVWVAIGCEDPEDVYAPPETPSAPTVTSGDSELIVTWPADPYANSYEVYFSTSDDSAEATFYTGDTDDADTTCVITGLENGTLYYVWIKAGNTSGLSDFSATSTGTPAAAIAPPIAPSAPTVTAGDGELMVTWNAVSEATSYEVFYATVDDSSAGAQYTGDSDSTDTSCVITGLENGTLYHVWIEANNAAGASDYSPSASGTPIATIVISDPPQAPTLVAGDRELTASWEPVSGATSYEVYFATEDISSSAIPFDGDADATDTTAVITGLVNGMLYYVWLKAVNAAGASDFSPSARVRVGMMTMSAGSVAFMMANVPVTTFPTGQFDDAQATVNNPYWIASTEVTYEVWHEVRAWAVDNGYSFVNAGTEGHDGTAGAAPTAASNEPVTWVNWCDVLVWSNALTEYFNDQNSTTLESAYQDVGEPIRDATDIPLCDAAEQDGTARGFRMLTGDEWELAARFIGDFNGDGDILDSGEYYPGGFASGSDSYVNIMSPDEDFDGDGDFDYDHTVCVFNGTSGSATAAVGTMNPNAMGLYDVCGNVAEWCFTKSEDRVYTMFRGGGWFDPATPVYNFQFAYRDHAASTLGFRVAMNE